MANPWDCPAIPKRGDENEEVTLLHVGMIMSEWESLEFELSVLFTWFAGTLHEQRAMAEYGKPRIFSHRSNALARKAATFFVRNCNQDWEADFESLLVRARGYGDRRNDIAHSIVFRIDEITFFREKIKTDLLKREHYASIPPLYAFRHADEHGFPKFAYTSQEMRRIGNRIYRLRKDVEKYRLDKS